MFSQIKARIKISHLLIDNKRITLRRYSMKLATIYVLNTQFDNIVNVNLAGGGWFIWTIPVVWNYNHFCYFVMLSKKTKCKFNSKTTASILYLKFCFISRLIKICKCHFSYKLFYGKILGYEISNILLFTSPSPTTL